MMRKLQIRDMPESLYERIRRLASVRNRSISAEAVVLLDIGLQHEERKQTQPAGQAVPLDRQTFMMLPLEERRRIMAQQAEILVAHYEQTADERIAWQAGDIIEY